MNENPFPGAAKKIRSKKPKVFARGKIKCTCGALEEFFCELYFVHDDKCIINRKRKK